MVGGVGWGCCSPVFFRAFRAPVLQTLQKQNCDGGGAGSPGGSLGRLRASSSPGVGWGWGRSCRAGVRRLCAEALKLCVLWSLPSLSLSPSLSPSVSAGRCRGCCSLETVGGWEDRDGWPVSAGLSPGRWAGVGVSGPVGGVLGASSPAGASSPSLGRCACRAAAGVLLLPAGLGLAGDTMGGVGSCWALIWGAAGLGLGFVKLHKFKG